MTVGCYFRACYPLPAIIRSVTGVNCHCVVQFFTFYLSSSLYFNFKLKINKTGAALLIRTSLTSISNHYIRHFPKELIVIWEVSDIRIDRDKAPICHCRVS